MNTVESAFSRINEHQFGGGLDAAFIWATLEYKNLMCELTLNRSERQLKLARAIESRYPAVGTKAQVLLAALVMAA